MSVLTATQLKEIIDSHGKWLRYEPDGNRANLSRSNLSWSDLSGSDLSGADLSGADLSGANLSGANGLPDTTKQFSFLEQFERTPDGYIVYKTFGETYKTPERWKIEENSILDEFTDFNIFQDCSCGINVASLDWIKNRTKTQIWKCLIRFEWLVGAVVPLETDGKFRTSRLQLLCKIDR